MTGTSAEPLSFIRPAAPKDAARIAEIEIFSYRLSFYPIFQNDWFYFDSLQVPKLIQEYEKQTDLLKRSFVYDDGVVKGFLRLNGTQVEKLFVEPVLHGSGIGSLLLKHAVGMHGADHLWALEKNTRAIAFYQKHGFHLTGERTPEEDTNEYLVRMAR